MEEKFFAFTYNKHIYTVNLNSKQSREDCQARINHNTGKKFKWFKESTGKRNWVLYDSDMYKVRCSNFITHYDVVLQYIDKDFRPEMPINASSCRCMFALHGRRFAADVLDFSNFNTENIVDMAYMFNGFYKCRSITLNKLNTSNVVDMTGMLSDCTEMEYLNIKNFDTSKVVSMAGMFSRCHSLIEIDLSGFDLTNVQNAHYMFYGCRELRTIKKLWCAPHIPVNATTCHLMFRGCGNIDFSNFYTNNVVDMSYMFYNADNTIKLDLSRFDTSKVETMEAMFSNMYALKYLDVSSFSTERLTNMDAMFDNCVNLVNLDLTSFDTGSVLYMLNTFSGCEQLEEILVSDKWSVCWGIEDGDRTFDGAKKLPNYNHVTTGADKGYDNRCGGYLTFK